MQQINKRLDFNAESTGAIRHEGVLFSFRLCHNKNSRTEIMILDLNVKSRSVKHVEDNFTYTLVTWQPKSNIQTMY